MIDLLSEEIEIEHLSDLVNDLVSRTLSFYQADENERNTLNKLFEIRASKLIPIIESGNFKILKSSGTNIRLFDEIKTHFDFNNEIWHENFDILAENWLLYILDNGVFKLDKFNADLNSFNKVNKCNLNTDDIKRVIELWMNGAWFEQICEEIRIETYQALRLINSLIGFSTQSTISAIIRIKELMNSDISIPSNIVNWTSFLQYGIKSQLELDLIEMGLIDRISVLNLASYIESTSYFHIDYQTLRTFLVENKGELLSESPTDYASNLL